MNLQFDTSCMTSREAQGIVALLSNLFPPAGQATNNLTPAPVPQPLTEQPTPQPGPILVAPQDPSPFPSPQAPESTSTRKRRTKAEIAADEAAAAQQAQQPANPSQASPAPAAEASATTQPAAAPQATVSADELRSLLNGYIAKHSMEDAIAKLRDFNCNRVTEALSLPADQLSLLAAALRG